MYSRSDCVYYLLVCVPVMHILFFILKSRKVPLEQKEQNNNQSKVEEKKKSKD